jgi:hypothetical protein
VADALEYALTGPDDGLDLPALPPVAVELLQAVAAPPRLAAHLRLVHAVAVRLLDWLAARYPALAVDGHAVRFGAATHDIGKAEHRAELTGPGSAHERRGYELLLAYGVAPDLAGHARTHGGWGPGSTLEELLVSLADAVWKGRREASLEELVVAALAPAVRRPAWAVYAELDDELTEIAAAAPARLAFQAAFAA